MCYQCEKELYKLEKQIERKIAQATASEKCDGWYSGFNEVLKCVSAKGHDGACDLRKV